MRLLVADDNAQWRVIIAHELAGEHELVGEVERGDEIIKTAERLDPELITLDVRMPGGSGMDSLKALRALLPKAIIVVVAATASPLYKEVAFARGADGYVDKTKVCSDLLPAIVTAQGRERHRHRN